MGVPPERVRPIKRDAGSGRRDAGPAFALPGSRFPLAACRLPLSQQLLQPLLPDQRLEPGIPAQSGKLRVGDDEPESPGAVFHQFPHPIHRVGPFPELGIERGDPLFPKRGYRVIRNLERAIQRGLQRGNLAAQRRLCLMPRTRWLSRNSLPGALDSLQLPRSWRQHSMLLKSAICWLNRPVSTRPWPLTILQEVLRKISCPKLPQRHPRVG